MRVTLNARVEDIDHLHQLGDQVRVTDVVAGADEHYQKGDKVVDARVRQNTWLIPERKS